MRRALAWILAVAAVVVVVVLVTTTGKEPPHYTAIVDNAFSLTEGADVRIDGVRAGKISSLDVDRRTYRARVGFTLDKQDAGGLRSDVFCEIRPQSLIGEYFLDCHPGTSPRHLPDGATIPVTQTASTIGADIVADTLREPYRDRLKIILSELGAGVAARGPDINETIRRAVPALRQTDRVLNVLAANRRTIRDLTRNADTVLSALARKHRDVGRFVTAADHAAQQSAAERTNLAATVHKLPGFLEQLRPSLADLGTAARKNIPTLVDLRASAPSLTTFFDRLGPFSESARPAVRSLGRASVTGRQAARSARPSIAELRRFAQPGRELGGNLSQVLRDLDDRSRAAEPDPDSPGGQGYTGLEALLQYVYDQVQAINIFDTRGHSLKLDLLVNECTQYTNAQGARDDPERVKRCSGGLGPNQPGVNQPDPSPAQARARHRAARHRHAGPHAPGAPATAAPQQQAPQAPQDAPRPPTVIHVPGLPPIQLPDLGGLTGGDGGRGGGGPNLLDYLLGP